MKADNKNMFWIKLPYWIGIAADGLWVVGLLSPAVYGLLTGNPGFNPTLDVRLLMGIAASLMAGWTALLVWGLLKPVERSDGKWTIITDLNGNIVPVKIELDVRHRLGHRSNRHNADERGCENHC